MILGIDQGTTGTRAGVMDGTGRFLSWAYRPHRQLHPSPGFVEHDPQEILDNTRTVIRETIEGAGRAAVAAVGLSNQGETVVLWDRESGAPVHPAIVWQDARTQGAMDRLAADPGTTAEVFRRTGLKPDAYFSASKIRWILDHVEEARQALGRGRLLAGTIDTWLIWNLSGRETFVKDPSTAARTLLFDIHALRWDPWLLELFGIPPEILPEVRPTTGVLARIRGLEAHGLPDGTPIAASLVDQPAAMAGHGCLEPGMTKATYGTGCFLYMNSGAAVPTRSEGLLATIAWQRDAQPTYALDGGIFTVGSAVEWARNLRLLDEPAAIDRMLEGAPADPGVIFVPSLAGLAAPIWDRGAAGAFLGLRLSTTRAAMVTAVLEGICMRVVQVVQAMQRVSATKVTSLRVDGGLTRCTTLMQIQADLLGIPVEVSAESEGATAGCCYLAARASGLWTGDSAIASRVAISRTYEPRAAGREARLARFEKAVSLVRSFGSEQ